MPIAPLPRALTISYLPRCVSSVTVARRAAPSATCAPSGGSERRPCCCRERGGPHLSFEHFHGLHEARLHAPHRLGQHADLVAARRPELARVELAEAHLV